MISSRTFSQRKLRMKGGLACCSSAKEQPKRGRLKGRRCESCRSLPRWRLHWKHRIFKVQKIQYFYLEITATEGDALRAAILTFIWRLLPLLFFFFSILISLSWKCISWAPVNSVQYYWLLEYDYTAKSALLSMRMRIFRGKACLIKNIVKTRGSWNARFLIITVFNLAT